VEEPPNTGNLSAESGLASLREMTALLPEWLARSIKQGAAAQTPALQHEPSGPPPDGIPYAFASYARADKQIVCDEIARFARRGARIWFDQYLVAGAQWIDQLGLAIKNAAVVVAFLSPRSIESSMVGKEILYAIGLQKPVIVIQIERAAIPPGKQLLLSDLQWVLRDQLSEQSYEEAVCAALTANAAM
jgi:hypothetical protein